MTNTDIVARHLRMTGRVQGVSFRASMVAEARRLHVTGWVRNRSDGCVEALVQGAPDAVQALIAWAGHGPARAAVERVQVSDAAIQRQTAFERRPSA